MKKEYSKPTSKIYRTQRILISTSSAAAKGEALSDKRILNDIQDDGDIW